MVDGVLKYLLVLPALLWLAAPLSASDYGSLPADTTLVFKKMDATEKPIKAEKPVPAGKKKVAQKKKKNAAKPVKAAKAAPAEKKKNDSVLYDGGVKYSLGDRVIMRGDSGADVKKLAEIMVKNLYLDENSIPYTKSGQVLYDGELLRAVKLFQKVSGLYEDGIVGEAAIKELRKIHRWRRTSK